MKVRWMMLGALTVGCAKQSTPEAAGSTATSQAHPSLVYAVERDGKRSTLMGTCHLPLALEERVDPALITSARELWVEARLDEVDLNAMLALMWDSERSTSTELGREAFARLTRKTGVQAPASMAEHMQPWALGVILGLADVVPKDLAQQLASGDTPVLDRAVLDKAREAEVPVRTVETVQEQLEMFAGHSVDLAALIEPDEATRAESAEAVRAMLELCTVNDLSALSPELYAADGDNQWLLVDRNARWVPQLLPSLEQGGAFIAVGALHLPGEHGLIHQLETHGYAVTNLPRPVPPSAPPAFEPPPVEPITLIPEQLRDQAMVAGAKAGCAEGQVFRSCFYPEPDVCEAELSRDLQLCADARFGTLDELKQGATDPMFTSCTMAGVIADSMVHGWPDRPACAPLRMAVEAAMQAYGAGAQ